MARQLSNTERMAKATEFFGPAYARIHRASTASTVQDTMAAIRAEINEARKSRLCIASYKGQEIQIRKSAKRSSTGQPKFIIDNTFTTPPLIVLSDDINYGKRTLLCISHCDEFNTWIATLEQQIYDLIEGLPDREPYIPRTALHDNNIIQASSFTHKYGSNDPNPILMYDANHSVIESHIQTSDMIQLNLKPRIWVANSVGWGLDIQYIVHHTPNSDRIDHHDNDDENIDYNDVDFTPYTLLP